jgi:hypothetical protein
MGGCVSAHPGTPGHEVRSQHLAVPLPEAWAPWRPTVRLFRDTLMTSRLPFRALTNWITSSGVHGVPMWRVALLKTRRIVLRAQDGGTSNRLAQRAEIFEITPMQAGATRLGSPPRTRQAKRGGAPGRSSSSRGRTLLPSLCSSAPGKRTGSEWKPTRRYEGLMKGLALDLCPVTSPRSAALAHFRGDPMRTRPPGSPSRTRPAGPPDSNPLAPGGPVHSPARTWSEGTSTETTRRSGDDRGCKRRWFIGRRANGTPIPGGRSYDPEREPCSPVTR